MIKFVRNIVKKYKIQKRNRNVQINSKEIIKSINKLMEEESIFWFLDFGTLLGVVRNGKILNWDGDIDIGIIADDDLNNIDILVANLSQRGFLVRAINYYNDYPTIIKLTYKHTSADVHIYYRDNNKLVCYLHQTKGQVRIDDKTIKKRVNRLICSDISSVIYKELFGIKVPIPENYSTILCEKYGNSWMVEDRNWTSDKTPGLLQMNEYGIVKIL